MTCPTCGSRTQPGATSCINISCADVGRPFSAEYLAWSAAAANPPAPPRTELRPLRGLAAVLSATTGLGVVCLVIFLVALAGATTTAEDEVPAEQGVTLLALLAAYAALLLAGAATLLVWIYQARSNLDELPDARPDWNRGWVLGAWFIPVANLWLVPRVFTDVVRETLPAGETAKRTIRLTLLWWGTWLTGWLVQFRTAGDGTTPGLITAATFAVISASSLLYVVWQVSIGQERRFSAVLT